MACQPQFGLERRQVQPASALCASAFVSLWRDKSARHFLRSKKWCAREDLNLQPLRDQILSLARLPFRHARSDTKLRPARRNLKPGFSGCHQANASLQPLRSWFKFCPMSFFRDRLFFSACAMGLGIALSGCTPPDQSRADEKKEPHFVLGQNRVNAMDYQGAIEAFEKSLEANPHSATAHYQLAMLFDEKEPDPVAAIYHYRQYLKLCPKADNAEVITQRIYTCKEQLIAEGTPLSGVPAVQKQLDQLADQNRQLQDEVNRWRAYYSSQLAAIKTNSPLVPTNVVLRLATNQPTVVSANTNHSGNVTTAIRPRTHTVAFGETAVGIARKYGVKLSALEAANPSMNPIRIRVGQVLNIPAR